MKHTLLLLLTLTMACNTTGINQCTNVVSCLNTATNQQVLRCGPCDDDPAWQPVQSSTYKSTVGEWNIFDCNPENFEKVDSDKSVLLGIRGYNSNCLFKSGMVDVSAYPANSKFRVTVTQEGSTFHSDIPYYTHLFINFSGATFGGNSPQFMPIASGRDYEATYTFYIPPGMTAFDMVLGTDLSYLGGQSTASDQPMVRLKTVKVDVLK